MVVWVISCSDLWCAGPLPAGWSEGAIVWYGRAELKQSDHRPVLAVVDVQAREVDRVKREQVEYMLFKYHFDLCIL